MACSIGHEEASEQFTYDRILCRDVKVFVVGDSCTYVKVLSCPILDLVGTTSR